MWVLSSVEVKNGKRRIPKLEENNYCLWPMRTKPALIQMLCWEVIHPEYSNELNETQAKSNLKASSSLLLIVSDCYIEDIEESSTIKEACTLSR